MVGGTPQLFVGIDSFFPLIFPPTSFDAGAEDFKIDT